MGPPGGLQQLRPHCREIPPSFESVWSWGALAGQKLPEGRRQALQAQLCPGLPGPRRRSAYPHPDHSSEMLSNSGHGGAGPHPRTQCVFNRLWVFTPGQEAGITTQLMFRRDYNGSSKIHAPWKLSLTAPKDRIQIPSLAIVKS